MFWSADTHALGDLVVARPELRRLLAQVVGTIDQEKQRALIGQMERDVKEHADSLFLYNQIQLFAVNKGVELVP